MHTVLDGLTISIPVKKGKESQLKALLESLGQREKSWSPELPFDQVENLHFASFLILPEDVTAKGKTLPARLMLMTTYNGSLSAHLDSLTTALGTGLHQLFFYCEEYPASETWSPQSLKKFMKAHKESNTVYPGYQHLTPLEIEKEEQLRKSIEHFLDNTANGLLKKTPEEIRAGIQTFVQNHPDLKWATKPYRLPVMNWINHFGPLIGIATVLATLVVLSILAIFWPSVVTLSGASILGAFILFVAVLVFWLRLNENLPPVPYEKASDNHVRDIVLREQKPVINEMSVAGPLKAGKIRPFFLKFTLGLLNFIRPLMYIPTVHTARWVALDGGRRVIFISYFDNTSNAYAHDFVDSTKRTRNVNLVLGHGMGFPPTRWAVLGGGKDRNLYMKAVRANQHITQIWYHTHSELSILNLNNNHEIRKGLYAKMDRGEIEKWLQRF